MSVLFVIQLFLRMRIRAYIPSKLYARASLQLVWPRSKFCMFVSHEGNTEEENNGYVIFRANIHESGGK
jgi:hypothetical protein